MTTETFTSKNFTREGGSEQWMFYRTNAGERIFVGRAKYRAQRKMLTVIKKALIGKPIARWSELLEEGHAPACAIDLM